MKKTIYALGLLLSLLIVPGFAAAESNVTDGAVNSAETEQRSTRCWFNCRRTTIRYITRYRNRYIYIKPSVAKRIAVSPSIVTMPVEGTQIFELTGGNGNFQWSAENGSLSATSGNKVTYTAPNLAGDDVITITDGRNEKSKIEIQVTSKIGTLSITPSQVHLAPGEEQIFTVNNSLEEVKWSADGGTITAKGTSQAIYTAPKSAGTYTIVATDYKRGITVEATVTVARKLTVTPTESQIGAAQTQTFSVAGGEEPYTWQVLGKGSLDIDSGNTVEFTAAKSTGDDKLVVMDNKGVSAEVAITVNSTLLITPANAVLPPNGTKIFSVSGGVGKVRFTATQGSFGAAGEYTAPADLGTYIITATDEAENTATVTVNVNNSPTVTPANAWVDRDGSIKFDVVGGRPPFAWHSTAGVIDVEGTNVTFKAPSESITASITVTDNAGQVSTSTVYVDIPLRATKQVAYAKPGERIRVAVTGGLPPFDWQAGNGEMEKVNTDTGGYNFFTAPKIMGETVINVRDRKNNTTEVKVYVTEPIKVTPNVRYMKREETKSFTVVSGVPPYTAFVVDGDGTLSPDTQSDDGRFTYTAGNVADKDIIIEFSDNSGQTVQAHVYVERLLRLTSGTLYVDKDTTAEFKVYGGTGGYVVEATSGIAEVDEKTGVGTYKSPNRYGEYTLTVIDSSDQTKDFVAKVERMVPVISPSIVTMAAGETKTFMVTRGVAPYEWTFEGGLLESQNENKSVVEVAAPETAGTYKLTVEDNAGNKAEATVEVFQPLLISPNSHPVYVGENVKVRFDKLGGAGKCDWVVTDLQEIDKADNYIVVQPRTDVEIGTTYSITCRDQNGDMTAADVIVGNLPADTDTNGEISDEELQAAIVSYFENTPLNGVQINKTELYLTVEANIENNTLQIQ
jgi:hypothetical protein